jgi:hypothetical protein
MGNLLKNPWRLAGSNGSRENNRHQEVEVGFLDSVLGRREPAAKYRTTDGGHPAPYPDMTDEQLYNYEVAFRVPKRTFDQPPGRASRRAESAGNAGSAESTKAGSAQTVHRAAQPTPRERVRPSGGRRVAGPIMETREGRGLPDPRESHEEATLYRPTAIPDRTAMYPRPPSQHEKMEREAASTMRTAQRTEPRFDDEPASIPETRFPDGFADESLRGEGEGRHESASAGQEVPGVAQRESDTPADALAPSARVDAEVAQESAEPKVLDLAKPVRTITTRQPVEIITTRARHPVYKVHGYIGDDEVVTLFTLDGRISEHGLPFLENVPQQQRLYVNVYRNPDSMSRERFFLTQHETRDEADMQSLPGRLACVSVDFDQQFD